MISLTKCYSVVTITKKELEDDGDITIVAIETDVTKYIVDENCLSIYLTENDVSVRIDSTSTNEKIIPFNQIIKCKYEYFNYISSSILGLVILILLPFIVIGIGFAISGAPKYIG